MPTLTFTLRNAPTPFRHEFPDDCVIHVGRADSVPGVSVSSRDGRYEVRADVASLSEDHCVLTIERGVVTLEDRGSRNGTFVRLSPGAVHPLDAQAVLLSKDLSLRLDDLLDPPLPEFREPTPERLVSTLRSHGTSRSLRVDLGPPADPSFPLFGDSRHLVVSAAHATRTLSIDDLAWVQRVVNAYNAACDARREEIPWRFLAASRDRRQALDQARRAAPTSLPVLLLGPTGSGKEVLAHDLHHHSSRRQGPFVPVNCATLDAERLEAQLFGYVRGAFTGAHADTPGLVEAAAEGTLFLDEVGDMAPAVQARLLRFLESASGEYRRMGDVKTRRANVRVIAATLRPLSGSDNKTFREDLYYRLAGVRIDIPRLAPDDIRAIVAHLLRDASRHVAAPPTASEVELIAETASTHPWPGGARELRQCVDRCVQLRGPGTSWRQSWEHAVDAPRPTPSIAPPSPAGAAAAQPAVVGRLLADLLFLRAARETRQVAVLARSLQMSYQAADSRLTTFDLRLDESDKIDALIAARTDELRRLVRLDPGLALVLQQLHAP